MMIMMMKGIKLFLLICIITCSTKTAMGSPTTSFLKNKIIPDLILEEATVALSHYPELSDTHIEFRFKPSLRKSLMKAQPKFPSLFGNRKDRKYLILMSRNFELDNVQLNFETIPKNVLIGWLGHELGHIMDYCRRSSLNLIKFGFNYYFSGKHIKEAERTADTFAVTHQMRPYILETKKFIIDHVDLSERYKARIKRLYLSPDEILTLVEEEKDH